MKPEEIRRVFSEMGADTKTISNGKLSTDAFTAFGIWEIALQLSELNQHITAVRKKIEG